ncbi:MAG: HAD family hydrolase [Treponema sp.]|jgi:phosphoglycolate phosphatase/putative hydrolase of the HAD superfamily|nr:HAD family hydrolase [Treponema sp.]
MNVYSLPSKISALLFDMDGTLYTNPLYAQSQIDLPIKKLAALQGKSFTRLQAEIAEFRAEFARTHNGRTTSLGNVFLAFGVSIEESVRWREELYEPEKSLRPDPRLREALGQLSAVHKLALVTNNPTLVAQKTLTALGIDRCTFSVIVGLDTCKVSKPNPAPFLKASELIGVPCSECVSIGDRFDVDIEIPLSLGMGGILVNGVEDVYPLAGFARLVSKR